MTDKYWFNTATNEVEFGQKSLGSDVLGPFDTEAEASRALDIVANRAQAWRDEEAEQDAADWNAVPPADGAAHEGHDHH